MDPDMDGEEWMDHKTTTRVSNLGRVWHVPSGRKRIVQLSASHGVCQYAGCVFSALEFSGAY